METLFYIKTVSRLIKIDGISYSIWLCCDLTYFVGMYSQERLGSSQIYILQFNSRNVPCLSRNLKLIFWGTWTGVETFLCKLFDCWFDLPQYILTSTLCAGAPRHPVRLHQTEPALFRIHVSQSEHPSSNGSRTSPSHRGQDSRFLRQSRRGQLAYEFRADLRAHRRNHRKYS